MKNSHIFRIANKLIWMTLAILALIFSGFKTTFDYTDTGSSYFDIYPGKHISVASIDTADVVSRPIRVQTNKEYSNVSFEIDNEIFTFDDGFTFNDIENGSFTIEYNSQLDSFLLYRDFHYLNGFSTIGLSAATLLIINFSGLILEIVHTLQKKKETKTRYYKSNTQKALNVINHTGTSFFILIGILYFISLFGFDLLYQLDQFTDIKILWLSFGSLFAVVIGLVIYELFKPSTEIKIENGLIEVTQKNDILFYAPLNDVVYSYQAIRSTQFFTQNYTLLNVTLNTKEHRQTGITIDFIPFGPTQYSLFVEYLSEVSTHEYDEKTKVDESPLSYTFRGQKSKNKIIFLITIITFLLLIVVSPIILIPFGTSFLFILLLEFIAFFGILIVFVLKSRKKMIFKIVENGLWIDDKLYEFQNIIQLEIGTPFEHSNFVRNIKIVTHDITIKYTLSENMNIPAAYQQYSQFARQLKEFYPKTIFK
ncbi:MAG: hypothetical protein RR565_08595 [Erysipelothrix sp.]